jgi:signal transduction histidine kinase
MSLKTKLTILITAFTLLTLAVFGTIVFSQARKTLETIRVAQLNNIADLKKDKIETFFEERKNDLSSLRTFSHVRMNLPLLSAPRSSAQGDGQNKIRRELDSELRPFQDVYGYLDIMLLDRHGRIVYTSNREHQRRELGTHLSDRRAFEEGRSAVYFSNVLVREATGKQYEMFGVAPVNDTQGRFIGAVVVEIDMGPIYTFVENSTGLGETGETLIDRKEGNEVLFLSPLRHASNAALQKKVPFDDKLALAAQKAAAGENGSGIAYDYRGTEVLAAWRYIPLLRWGLVTKIDSSEAFAPVTQLRASFLMVGLAMLLLGTFSAWVLATAITRPVFALQKGAEAIAAGNLDQKVATGSRDEIGRLASTFDAMTEALARDRAGREKAETEVKKLNEDLRQHVRQLEESNRELDAFSYSVSHDLRSPLRSIDGFSLALLEDQADKLDTEGKDYLDRIRNATQRMSQLIDDLLKLSRIARFEMKPERIDLSAMAADMAARMQKNHPGRSAEFIIADGLIAHGDERLLMVVLENLFANAWKFSEKTPRPVIEFGAEIQSETVVYFVKDNGAGFDMAFADKLFNPFQRLHKVSEFSGTGIGLATVKRVINRHGGKVWIEGEVGKGTTVYFTL